MHRSDGNVYVDTTGTEPWLACTRCWMRQQTSKIYQGLRRENSEFMWQRQIVQQIQRQRQIPVDTIIEGGNGERVHSVGRRTEVNGTLGEGHDHPFPHRCYCHIFHHHLYFYIFLIVPMSLDIPYQQPQNQLKGRNESSLRVVIGSFYVCSYWHCGWIEEIAPVKINRFWVAKLWICWNVNWWYS